MFYKKAFTLVELMISISILAILWTISFIWYANYWKDANNTKVKVDLNNINNNILLKKLDWICFMNFVSWNDENRIDVNIASFWWRNNLNITEDIYKTGLLNYVALWIKKENFIAPDWNQYRIWATTTYWWRLELAGVIVENQKRLSFIKWNFFPRKVIKAFPEHISGNIVTLKSKYINIFKNNDRVKLDDGNFKIIKKANKDWVTLVFNSDMTWVTSLELALEETQWLLATENDNTKIITNYWENLPY